MKKCFCLALVVTGLFLTAAAPAHAWGRGGHGGFSTHVFIGAPFWGPPLWVGPYWYPPYAYAPPPVVIREEPQVYVQQQPPPPAAQESYWYYCADAKAYYPYVQQCPGGWLKVVPQTTPPGQ